MEPSNNGAKTTPESTPQRPVRPHPDSLLKPKHQWIPRSWPFWRNLILYFCLFSWVGHWMEIGYCTIMDSLFHIVDPNSGVWQSPLFPFPVYGCAVVVIALVMEPFRGHLIHRWAIRGKSKAVACWDFYWASVLLSMCMELAQGFIQNQPDENGVYPLWDNSQLPGNILGQAWIVNDLLLGALVSLMTWVVYPLCERTLGKVPDKVLNAALPVVLILFVACLVLFQ
ncbi:MAG: putative ABC transporter permease [Coriobacteriia bacterium]|nr:putative ABC transporter permease [Coriobacteriia bacterium]